MDFTRMVARHLSQLLEQAAAARPGQTAVLDQHGRCLSYAELERAAAGLSIELTRWGIDRGDRVGLWVPKSLEAVTAIHGILRSGAAYVPVDPTGPALRAAAILAASEAKAAVVSAALAPSLRAAWPSVKPFPRLIVVEDACGDPCRCNAWCYRNGRRCLQRSCLRAAIGILCPLARLRRRRPRLHPLHLGIDRPAQGRDALARERIHVHRLVLECARAVALGRSLRVACPVPLRSLGIRPLRCLPGRRDARAGG